MAIQPFGKEIQKIGDNLLLLSGVIDVCKGKIADFVAEKRVLHALTDQLRIADLRHVSLLMCKMGIGILRQLLQQMGDLGAAVVGIGMVEYVHSLIDQ